MLYTIVPLTKEPLVGFVTGDALFDAVKATLGTKSPCVLEVISNIPLGVVVPIPIWA
ncbi:hypothetical protein D3C85_1892810 [compost metagenome]